MNENEYYSRNYPELKIIESKKNSFKFIYREDKIIDAEAYSNGITNSMKSFYRIKYNF